MTPALLFLVSLFVVRFAPYEIASTVVGVAWIVYLLPLTVIVTIDRPGSEEYPWYLAWKTGQSRRFWTGYWYRKFRRALRRYFFRTFRSSAGDLLVQFKTLRSKPPDVVALTTDQVPGTRLLLRAFRQKGHELSLLNRTDQQSAVKAQVTYLEQKMSISSRRRDSYLRHLVDIWFGYASEERDLIIAHAEPTILERLDESPTLQKLLWLSVGTILALIYGALRLVGLPIP